MPKFVNLDGEFYNVAEIAAVYKDTCDDDNDWHIELRNQDTFTLTNGQYDTLARILRSYT